MRPLFRGSIPFLAFLLLLMSCSSSPTTSTATQTATVPAAQSSLTAVPTVNPACSQVTAVTKGWSGTVNVHYTYQGTSANQQITAATQVFANVQFDETAHQDGFTGFYPGAASTVIYGDFDDTSFALLHETSTPLHGTATTYQSFGVGSSGGYGRMGLGLPETGEFITLGWQTATCMYGLYFYGGDIPVQVTTATDTHAITYPFFAMDTGFIASKNDPHLQGTMTIPINTATDTPPYFLHSLVTTQGNIGSVVLQWDLRPKS